VNGADAPQYTVSQAAELIRLTLERKTPFPLRIIGQVSNLNARAHWYFSLKDQQAVLNCVAWATSVRRFNFQPKDGDEIIATGHLSFYAPQGRIQLYVSDISPVGAGALEMRFRAMCATLRELGYFEEARKRPLPMFPRRIAVITSASGAAAQDVITTAGQRCKAVGIVIVNVRVQGEGAAQQIAHAIKWVDRHHARLKVDAMLVTRGGGSIEDLWAFNEREVADAIYHCSLPVVAAIGHESDTTIAELVADVRASTPTQAAMRMTPSGEELCRHLDHVAHRIRAMVGRLIERQRERSRRCASDLRRIAHGRATHERARLERISSRLGRLRPQRLLLERQARLRILEDRLRRSIAQRLDQRRVVTGVERTLSGATARHMRRLRDRLRGLERQLVAVDPHGVLRRGYSITTHTDGRLIRSVQDVIVGDGVVTRVMEGQFESTVTRQGQPRVHVDRAKSQALSRRGRTTDTKRDRPQQREQMDLF
jgi:exodeoxyribonuclease VII large subunit